MNVQRLDAGERKDIIEKRGSKWVLLSHEGKVLGEHATEEEAKAQENAINIAKARAAGHHIPKKDCRRIDAGQLKKPVKLSNGWLKADGYLTRTGVFLYRNPDGSVRRELRIPDEVFKKDALESFSMVPVTDDHPPEFLTAENTTKYARGAMSEAISRAGDFVHGSMLVTDAELIKKMESGDQAQVSCGYVCDLDETPGVTADGEKYDGIQRNIRGNHVAIVDRGRAGPEARVRMDSAAAAMLSIVGEATTASSEEHTVKIKIDGVEYEAGSEQAVAAMTAYQTKLDAQARANAETKEKFDSELKAAPAKVAAELKARMSLEAQAKEFLGKKFKFDGLTDREVKLAVLEKLDEKFDGKGKSDAYVDGRYDAALEAADGSEDLDEREDEDDEEGVAAARRVLIDDEDDDDEPGNPANEMTDKEAEGLHEDVDTARRAMEHRNRNAWKTAFTKQ